MAPLLPVEELRWRFRRVKLLDRQPGTTACASLGAKICYSSGRKCHISAGPSGK